MGKLKDKVEQFKEEGKVDLPKYDRFDIVRLSCILPKPLCITIRKDKSITITRT